MPVGRADWLSAGIKEINNREGSLTAPHAPLTTEAEHSDIQTLM